MSPELIEQAAREVLQTTAGTPVLGASRGRRPQGHFDGVMATISLSGSRGGTLILYCDRPLANRVTSAILRLDDEEPGDETVIDAMGEIANQVGGTLKRKLGASGAEMMLSVPVVAAAAPITHSVKSTHDPVCIDVHLETGSLCLCLWPA